MKRKVTEPHWKLDIRFVKDKTSVLVENKQKFSSKDRKQLFDYVKLEKELTGNNIIAMLANTTNYLIEVWKNEEIQASEVKIKTMGEYVNMFKQQTINNKEKVMQATYELNKKLHEYGVAEFLRSQFVGTCLLSLKNDLTYKGLPTRQIVSGMKEILENLLNKNLNKASKLSVLDNQVLQHQHISHMKSEYMIDLLNFTDEHIMPFISQLLRTYVRSLKSECKLRLSQVFFFLIFYTRSEFVSFFASVYLIILTEKQVLEICFLYGRKPVVSKRNVYD